MSIKPVLVPDHDAVTLRRLMDSFAEAATGPTRQQLTESRSAVAADSKKKRVSEGIMDVVKQTFNDCVAGYPQGTSEGQFLQGWARAIRAETGRDIPPEKLTRLYHDYSKRSPEIMQSHGTMDEDSYKDTRGTFKDRLVGEILNFYTTHGRIPRVSEYSRAVRSKLNSLDYDERSKLHRQANVKALKLAGKQGYFSKLGLDEGEGSEELKAIDGDYYEDSTDFFSMFEQDHFDREEESADGMEIRGYIDDKCVMVFKFSTPDMMGGWGIYDDSALIAESGVEDNEEEGETCPECDGAGCPECYGDEDRDRAHDHAQGMERESAGMAEGGRPDVMRHRGDTTVKVVKRAGKPIGEIGIDAEASEGNGQYYVKLYDGSYDASGFDTAAEALAELKAAISEGITETAAVKYGVFAKGGSVGSQRFRDDPLKTFDTKEEAVADARRRRSGLSQGERGYYRMGYVVKPIKGSAQQVDEIDMGLVGDAVAGAAMGLGSVGLGSYIGHKIGNKIGQKFVDRDKRKEAEAGSEKMKAIEKARADRIAANKAYREHENLYGYELEQDHPEYQNRVNLGNKKFRNMDVPSAFDEEQQVDEKSEAVRHANNHHDHRSIYHVDESVDPIEQLRADIRRFAQ